MRNYWITVTLRNGCKFAGCLSARSFSHARLLVRANAARTDILSIDVEGL